MEAVSKSLQRQKQHSIVWKRRRSWSSPRRNGTVVFAIVTTVPCSGRTSSLEEFETLRGVLNWPERWNVVTTRCFDTASSSSTADPDLHQDDTVDEDVALSGFCYYICVIQRQPVCQFNCNRQSRQVRV